MSYETHSLQAQRDRSAEQRNDLIIGPGFQAAPDDVVIPHLCVAGSHCFEKRGVCKTCRRTVAELARLGLAQPVSCKESGIHVLAGPSCIECRRTILKGTA